MYHDPILLIAAALYLLAAGLLYCSIQRQSRTLRLLSVTGCVAGALLHGFAQSEHWIHLATADVSLLSLMSLCALVIAALLCISAGSKHSYYDAGIVALPVSALVLLFEWAVPAQTLPLLDAGPETGLHIVSSVLAFGVLSIAGVYALFAALIDHFLRRHHLNPLVTALPPLESLEHLLFQLISIGFLLLTASLASGLAFVDDLFAQHLAHKTILSITAWLVFGLLIWGRWRYGWRGRRAVRLTLAGIILLLLAYFGSKLVLEIILDRSWRN